MDLLSPGKPTPLHWTSWMGGLRTNQLCVHSGPPPFVPDRGFVSHVSLGGGFQWVSDSKQRLGWIFCVVTHLTQPLAWDCASPLSKSHQLPWVGSSLHAETTGNYIKTKNTSKCGGKLFQQPSLMFSVKHELFKFDCHSKAASISDQVLCNDSLFTWLLLIRKDPL